MPRFKRGLSVRSNIKRIGALKGKKIIWHKELNSPHGHKIIISIDGVDFKIWEPKNPRFNRDPSWCSNKFKAAGVQYELGIDIWSSKLVWINGPHKCGSNPDQTIFKSALMQKIPTGKKGIADKGYEGCEEKICIPSSRDPRHISKFSSWVRCRHENFNGRIKNFASMSNTWTHGVKKTRASF
jgi:hypothetical protein